MNEKEFRYKNKILEAVKERLGKDNAIRVAELMELIPLNDREIRRVIQHLVNEDKYPIGSTPNPPYGFFMIVSIEDYLEAVKNLFNRKTKIKERIDSLKEACEKEGVKVPQVEIHKQKGSQVFNISNSVVIYLK